MKETWEYYSWTQYSSSSIPDNMPTKGQRKKDMKQAKLKQEELEVYKEKMELAIADYKLAFCDPATKKSMQEVAGF